MSNDRDWRQIGGYACGCYSGLITY